MNGFAAPHGPLLIAHRGASAEHVENTLPAFHGALALGADVIESDVHITRDGHAVLAHDADGLRVANDPRAIAACTFEEISAWNLAPQGAAPCCIPSLRVALSALPNALFNLDLKVHDASAVPHVLEVIARHDAEPRVLLTSFSADITRALRAHGYKGPIGLGQAEAAMAVFAPRTLLRMQRPFSRPGTRLQIPTSFHGLPLTRRPLIEKLRALSIPIDYWVVNDPDIARDLLARGASGIVTDDVRAMREVFASSEHTEGWRARQPERLLGDILQFSPPADWRAVPCRDGLLYAPRRDVDAYGELDALALPLTFFITRVADTSDDAVENLMRRRVPQGHPDLFDATVAALPAHGFDYTDGVRDILSFFVRSPAGVQVELSLASAALVHGPRDVPLRDLATALLATVRWR